MLIVTDVRLFRDGLAELMGRHVGIEVVAATRTHDAFQLDLVALAPDVVLWDVVANGIEFVRDFIARTPRLRVLILSLPEKEREIIRFAEAGIAGYVTREAGIGELVAAVRSAARGEAICSPRIAASLLRHVAARAFHDDRQSIARLTAREVEILDLIRGGMTNKEIGVALAVEVSTVKNHVHNILEKLGVHRRAEAALRIAGLASVAAR